VEESCSQPNRNSVLSAPSMFHLWQTTMLSALASWCFVLSMSVQQSEFELASNSAHMEYEAPDCQEGGCDVRGNDLLLLQTSMEFNQLLVSEDDLRNTTDTLITTPAPNVTAGGAGELTGVTMNAAGDLAAFISACVMNGVMWFIAVAVASCLRVKYPEIYANNALCEITKIRPDLSSYLGWIRGSLDTSIEDAKDAIGLDNALLLEFSNLCMRILGTIAVPLVCIMCPLHLFCGGDRAGEDHLSAIAMGNVVDGHPWLYYCHAVCVWYTTLVTTFYIYSAQRKFVKLRFQWLKDLGNPRASTVLVEGIPDEYCSDAKLKEFFCAAFGSGSVREAHMVKHTDELCSMVNQLEASELSLNEMEKKQQAEGQPQFIRKGSFFGEEVNAIQHYEEKINSLKEDISKERSRIKELSPTVGGINGHNGFVTFFHEKTKETAIHIQFSEDASEWNVSMPPDPKDIRWTDLKSDATLGKFWMFIGYACVFGLYIGFMPICIFVTNLANSIQLGPVWAAFAPTLGLLIFLSFLPTFLLLIFHVCFKLGADAESQHKLQVWYFWFQVFFVILVTAIGTSLVKFFSTIAQDPFSIFKLLADQLPWATHFYMNYLVLQIATHSTNFTRYVTLSKYIMFKKLYDDETARALAEPEDQDYYGLGGRSARFAINMLIGLIFSTLSPLCAVLGFINFAVCRLLYGYMIVFAETKKPDLGGVFWVSKLKHVQFGLIIYCVLMIGVLNFRAPTYGPMIVAIPSLFFAWMRLAQFDSTFQWETLPFKEVMAMKDGKPLNADSYQQPELTKT